MNLLILILIVFINTIKPLTTFELNNGLVFIKPENLTKTELVEKFKELSSSKSLNDLKNKVEKDEDKITLNELFKSYYLGVLRFIQKSLIKIALFSILIKYFRKIRILRFIFRITNYIFLSTFGIFISDIYGLKEIIAGIEYYWMEYVNFIHESKIYKTLLRIFSDENKTEIIEEKSKDVEINSETQIIKSESKIINSEFPSSGRELNKKEIFPDKTNERDTRENWFKLDKYFWVGLTIISVSFIYIYWDSIIEFLNNGKPDNNGSPIIETPKNFSYEEEYKQYFKEISTNEELYDLETIKTQKMSKTMDYTEVEKFKWGDSPTTPKASSSKLPETQGIMVPLSKK